MLTKEGARGMVVAELARPPEVHVPRRSGFDLVIVDESTIEKKWRWIFFYNSERYLTTGEISHALAGNAPYIVNRHTGEMRSTGTAYPIEHYIAEYQGGTGS